MRNDYDTLISILLVAALLVGLAGYSVISCHSRWDGVRESSWGLFSGCRVATGIEGAKRFVPEKRIWYERNQ